MSGHMMAGGKKAASGATEKGRELATKHQAEIEAKVGGATGTFEPVSQRTQVVAGTNYYLKIRTGDDKYVHARVWHKLDGTSELHDSVEGNKSLADEL